jgi:FkbM family methyltransferase
MRALFRRFLRGLRGLTPPDPLLPTGRDLVCKWFEFPEGAGAFLALPAKSDDPVVAHYLAGRPVNTYMLEILAQTTDVGDQVVDLGCHVGTFAIGAAAMGRRVVAVDASPFHIALVGHSRDINHLSGIQLYHAAISQSEGTIQFTENGLFGAIDFAGTNTGAVEVPAKGIGPILAQIGTGSVKFRKMNIEGAEVDAVLTGLEVLRRDQPVIWYESNGPTLQQAGWSIVELRRLLEAQDYRTYRVEDGRWVYAPPDQIQPEAWVDMLALCAGDRQLYAARIDSTWTSDAILEKCSFWADLPYPSTRTHLRGEIGCRAFDPAIAEAMAGVAANLDRLIGSAASLTPDE